MGILKQYNETTQTWEELINLAEVSTEAMGTTATSADIKNGKTAWCNGVKITGTALPSETTATENDLLVGKTAYTADGQLLTGKALPAENSATAEKILKGYTAYGQQGQLITGTALSTVTNATAATIRNGYKAYDNNGTLITGTAYATTTNASNATVVKNYNAYTNTGTLLTGSAPQIKTGTVTASSSTTLTISGLGFTPSYIMLELENAVNTYDTVGYTMGVSKGGTSVWSIRSGMHSISAGRYAHYVASGVTTVSFSNGSVTLTSNSSTYNFYPGTYRYIVWN